MELLSAVVVVRNLLVSQTSHVKVRSLPTVDVDKARLLNQGCSTKAYKGKYNFTNKALTGACIM